MLFVMGTRCIVSSLMASFIIVFKHCFIIYAFIKAKLRQRAYNEDRIFFYITVYCSFYYTRASSFWGPEKCTYNFEHTHNIYFF